MNDFKDALDRAKKDLETVRSRVSGKTTDASTDVLLTVAREEMNLAAHYPLPSEPDPGKTLSAFTLRELLNEMQARGHNWSAPWMVATAQDGLEMLSGTMLDGRRNP